MISLTMINYRGKRLRIHAANGQRFGFGYLPHWVHNKDTQTPRQLIIWCGPLIATWNIRKKGWVPRAWNSDERYAELVKAEHQLYMDILQIEASRKVPLADTIGRLVEEMLSGPQQWAAESDAVNSRKRAKENGTNGVIHCGICGEKVTLGENGLFTHDEELPHTMSHEASPCFWDHAEDVNAEQR